eukprot:TRINITY_DN2991_c0_g1_i1.p1 TRINITY_DN2991_c0_g1~~TRINITY_DN2991_c0_g1_i1.p1  ORF type:complete len:53 (+),score=12.81 TRINITY_DN2991_c0_g1_i1:265-423(+)
MNPKDVKLSAILPESISKLRRRIQGQKHLLEEEAGISVMKKSRWVQKLDCFC